MTSYLGSIYRHRFYGEGIVIFEEDSNPEAWRVLLIAFADTTQEVIPERLDEHGYVATGERLELAAQYRRLPGHDAVSGWGCNVLEAVRAMQKERLAVT